MENKRYVSVSFWIKMFMVIILVPLLIVLIFINLNTRKNLREQSASINNDMLGLYMEQIDSMLEELDIYLTGFSEKAQNIENIVTLQLSDNQNDRQLAKHALYTSLVAATGDHSKANGFFVYVDSDRIDDPFFNGVNSAKNTDMVKELNPDRIYKKMLQKIADGELNTKRWFRWKLGEDYYLLRITYDHGIYVGCWLDMEALLHPLEKINLGENGFSLLATEHGQVLTPNPQNIVMLDLDKNYENNGQSYTLAHYDDSYLQIAARSRYADVYLMVLIPDAAVLEKFVGISNVLIGITILILILFPLSGVLVSRYIYRPLNDMTVTMEKIRDGNVHIKARDDSSLTEFHILSTTFNDMVDEMNRLKISVYEQQLKEKETYLQYLQLQIHPHFFLNCMSLMHGLAELEKYREIQKLSKSLVKYFRYMFKKATTLICVREELNHVDNYMDIQKMRFPRGITYTVEVPDGLLDARLPPLSIQTFVENSIKYAVDLTRTTTIQIRLEQLGDNMKVSIRDNGAGFPVDVLMVANSENDLFSQDETLHIGIRNVKERLKLIFGENSFIHFYNDQGSVVEYIIPVNKGENCDV